MPPKQYSSSRHAPSNKLCPLCLTLLSAGALSITAQANDNTYPTINVQESPLPFRQFDKVEITGSSIIRKEQTQALPVQVITRKDIINSGFTDIAEVIQQHTSTSGNTNSSHLGLVKGGYDSASMRGLESSTLVLLNGSRVASYGRPIISGTERSSVDLRLVPLSAVEKVEILTDGASSIYGTDAIAGVINIITRTEQKGFAIDAFERIPDRQRGRSHGTELSWGYGQLQRDGYAISIFADIEQQRQLLGSDRPYASAGRYLLERDGKNYWAYGSSLTPFQSGQTTLASSTSSPYAKLWNSAYTATDCLNGMVPAWGKTACLYNPYADTGLYPNTDSKRLHVQGQRWIDSSAIIFAEATLQDIEERRSYSMWPTYTAKISSSAGAPGSDLAQANGLTPGSAYLLWRPTEFGLLDRVYTQKSTRIKVGSKGSWREWDYNVSLNVSESSASSAAFRISAYPNLGVANDKTLTNASLLYPIFSNSDGSAQLQQQLLAARYYSPTDVGTNELRAIHLSASRVMAHLDDGDVLLAVGAELRQESSRYEALSSFATQPTYQGSRRVQAHYAELQWPLRQNIDVIGSIRHDQYSDVGDTTHGKLSTRWKIDDSWMLRASTGTGFRAPSVAQVQPTGEFSSGSFSTPCNSNLQALINLYKQQNPLASCPANGIWQVITAGNPALKPEQSQQDNLGLRHTWSQNHSFGLDWWRIKIHNAISPAPINNVVGAPLANQQYLRLQADGSIRVFNPLINLGDVLKSGLDLSWQYRKPTDWGQVNASMTTTYFLKSERSGIPDANDESDLGRYASTGSVTPRMKLDIRTSISNGLWTGLLGLNRVSSYYDSGVSVIDANTGASSILSPARVPAFTTVDAGVRYQLSQQLDLDFNVQNIFNTKAPTVFWEGYSAMYGTSTSFANLWGRTVTLRMRARF